MFADQIHGFLGSGNTPQYTEHWLIIRFIGEGTVSRALGTCLKNLRC